MNVVYSEKVKQRAEDYAWLQKATDFLEKEVLGKYAATTKAEWDRTEDAQGETLYTLRISDPVDSAIRTFTQEEVTSSWIKSGLRLLWDDILRARIDRGFQQLLDTPA